MNQARDQLPSPPAVALQGYFSSEHHHLLDSWCEAAVSALDRAVALGAVSSWRIAAGGGAEDSALPLRFESLARDRGGSFSWTPIDSRQDAAEAHRILARTGDEALVLLLDPRATILGSSVARLVEELGTERGALAARAVPVSETDGSRAAVLVARASLSDVNPGAGMPIAADSTAFFASGEATEPLGVETRSLLEESLNVVPLSTERDTVASVLSSGEELLLSVVLRTQGARPEALRETLLCLAGQSDGRFELLIVVHDANSELVEEIMLDLPPFLVDRARVLVAEGGSRAHPLNVGISASRGSHVVFLDDDDVVFSHWISSFLLGAEISPRQLIRSVAGVQAVSATQWPGGLRGHEISPVISKPYPGVFDLADHLRVNMTPFMSIAFPRSYFAVFGGADESLDVCEDWDLVLGAASILGVHDVPQVTAIYRRWTSGGDSYTRHDSAIWQRDMRKVRAKLDARPLLLPPGSATSLAELSGLRDLPTELAALRSSTSWKVTGPLRAIITRIGEGRARITKARRRN